MKYYKIFSFKFLRRFSPVTYSWKPPEMYPFSVNFVCGEDLPPATPRSVYIWILCPFTEWRISRKRALAIMLIYEGQSYLLEDQKYVKQIFLLISYGRERTKNALKMIRTAFEMNNKKKGNKKPENNHLVTENCVTYSLVVNT